MSMSGALYTVASCCGIPKLCSRLSLERWEKMTKIFGTLFAVLGVLGLIAAASVGRLWLHIAAGLVFIAVGFFGVTAALLSKRPAVSLAFAVVSAVAALLIFAGCVVWLALVDDIVEAECDELGLSSGACRASRSLNIAFTAVLLFFDLLLCPYAISGFFFHRTAVAVKRYRENKRRRKVTTSAAAAAEGKDEEGEGEGSTEDSAVVAGP